LRTSIDAAEASTSPRIGEISVSPTYSYPEAITETLAKLAPIAELSQAKIIRQVLWRAVLCQRSPVLTPIVHLSAKVRLRYRIARAMGT
jgi:hypothetical protein